MNTQARALASPDLLAAWRRLRGVLIGLGAGLLLIGLLFHAEVASALRVWIDSTAYNHCFLIVPIAAYLAWDRRESLRGLTPTPAPRVALAGIPLALAWLAAERLGVMEGRQLAALSFVELLFLAVLGRRLWWALSGPLLYLYFLVPFGEFLVPRLQDITTVFIRHGLDILRIPAFIDGYVIEIPEGTFHVAEACAGLRFLIASIAFGCLYALMMYRDTGRRLVFILVSIAVPVIANGFRALGIVVLGHILGSAQAAAADHVLYGWIFFSLVILLLIALGLPFRQDGNDPAPTEPMDRPGGRQPPLRFGATLAVVAVAAIGPAVAAGLAGFGSRRVAEPMPLDLGGGCITVAANPVVAPGAPGRLMTQRVACGATELTLTIETFPTGLTAAPVLAERRRLSRPPGDPEEVSEAWLVGPDGRTSAWRMVRSQQPAFTAAAAVWLDGEATRAGLRMRVRLALATLSGARFAPVVVAVAPAVPLDRLDPEERQRIDRFVSEFLLSHPEIDDQVRALATVRDP